MSIKISQLTSAAQPLSGGEKVVMNQNGITVTTPLSNIKSYTTPINLAYRNVDNNFTTTQHMSGRLIIPLSAHPSASLSLGEGVNNLGFSIIQSVSGFPDVTFDVALAGAPYGVTFINDGLTQNSGYGFPDRDFGILALTTQADGSITSADIADAVSDATGIGDAEKLLKTNAGGNFVVNNGVFKEGVFVGQESESDGMLYIINNSGKACKIENTYDVERFFNFRATPEYDSGIACSIATCHYYTNDAAAASGGLSIGDLYFSTATSRFRVRTV